MKRDPFRVEGPAVVSFSGGRTSGYMLRRILDAHGGTLPDDVHVLFANTGRERIETLDFVAATAEQWGVDVVWLERSEGGAALEVDPAEASRHGEPFAQLIRERRFVPNPGTPYCSTELKTRLFKHWMRAQGYEHWRSVVGYRADEWHRIARARELNAQGRERWTNVHPLGDAGVTRADVDAFWSAQPFDLQLAPHEGNCDLCFKKSAPKRLRLLADRPDLAAWWIAQERETGTTFDRVIPVATLLRRAKDQRPMPLDDDGGMPCACTD